ncbi:hypothetical protein B0H14DRAFT_2558142 [Mycena olivaceomarginata]|nr:hypothetical protein B0H14DRAFT_2558142 [Mycena olivaceomarginata]
MRARTVGNLHRGVGLESHRTPMLHLSSFLCLLMLGGRMEVCAVAHEVSEVTGNSISTLGRGCRGGWQQMGVWVPRAMLQQQTVVRAAGHAGGDASRCTSSNEAGTVQKMITAEATKVA